MDNSFRNLINQANQAKAASTSSFATVAKTLGNVKATENGAVAMKSTNSALMDLFATIGALRQQTPEQIEDKFEAAFQENPILATKMAFYARDIREGGLGERRTARIIFAYLAKRHPDFLAKNVKWIPHFGRFDDWYSLVGTPLEDTMWANFNDQLRLDVENAIQSKPFSMLAKWAKSEGASSKVSTQLAVKGAAKLGLTPRNYRKVISALREDLNIVERAISAGKIYTVDYEKVPSKAMSIYKNLFAKKDAERFAAYKAAITTGEAKINAATLYPMDLVKDLLYKDASEPAIIEAQWKALPNYVSGESNILVMADVSGSMQGDPMAASIGLATYFAQRNKGLFHNLYMTFTDNPRFVSLRDGMSLRSIVEVVKYAGIGYSTNLEKAFETVLKTAIAERVPQSQMPKALVVISDMEIDRYTRDSRTVNFLNAMLLKFARAGYDLPKIVFWNVEARQDTFHAEYTHPYVQFVSGFSAGSFKSLIANIEKTAYEAMVATLSDPAYDVLEFPK